ncbi:hypothetical protein J3Q64DRAFT_1753756 [Phycomyces blakesleeanus]|uniref:DRBM domain-containing protein n=1 Tax=Phycomyces blakesleeanus TaxID=4837 RepID=A0ABR3ATX7_PHYBL
MITIPMVESQSENKKIYPGNVKDVLSRLLTSLNDASKNQLVIEEQLPIFEPVFVDLTKLMVNPNTLSIKNYSLIGENALKSATSIYLVKKHSWATHADLEKIFLLIFTNSRLQTSIGNKFKLDEFCDNNDDQEQQLQLQTDPVVMINRFAGVLYCHHGLSALERWVKPLLDLFCPVLLKQLPRVMYNRLFGLVNEETENMAAQPAQIQFTTYVQRVKGEIVINNEQNSLFGRSLGWNAEVLYKLSPTSDWHTHSRHAINKRKARDLAMRDILAFYKSNPGLLHTHRLSSVNSDQANPDVLNIPPCDYAEEIIEASIPESLIPPISRQDDQQAGETHARKEREGDEQNCQMFSETDLDEEEFFIDLTGDNPVADKRKKPLLDCDDFENTTDSSNGTNQNVSLQRPSLIEILKSLRPPPIYDPVDLKVIKQTIYQKPKLEILLKQKSQERHPKDQIYQIKHYFEHVQINMSYDKSGPLHRIVFDAICEFKFQDLTIVTNGRGTRKSEAEIQAYHDLLVLLRE